MSALVFLGGRDARRALAVAKPASAAGAAQWVIDPALAVTVLTRFGFIHFHLLFVPIRPV
jgi:polyisoprenoid-binding protein YceI